MSKTTILFFISSFLIILKSNAQTQLWSDTFEDAGAPSSGTRTPSVTFNCAGPPSTAYFYRTNLAGVALQSGAYSGFQGTKFWAGEDIDNGAPCVNSSISPTQTVICSGINISGKGGLSFRGLFAANNAFANNWEGSGAGVNQDVLTIEYRIDAGAWTKIVAFYASAAANSTTLKLETTGDLQGDGADLTYVFTEYTAAMAGTGTLLDLRVTFSSNNGATEEMAVDNLRVFYLTALPVELTDFNSLCANDTETITWNAESEINFDHYTLEQSTDLVEYTSLAEIPSKSTGGGPAEYAYTLHPNASNQQLYYRLGMVDLDGTTEYSAPIAAKNCASSPSNEALLGYFFQDDQLILNLKHSEVEIELFSLLGQSLTDVLCGEETLKMIPIRENNTKFYLLRVTDLKDNQTLTYRIYHP
ncbi:MAG: hypothetical protein V4604_04930 [Bacteroidota bacterium]